MNKQEEIRSLIKSLGIRESWLASKLGLKKHTLHYLVYETETLDDDLHHSIKEAIKSYQYEFSFFDDVQDESYDLFDDDKIQEGIGERIRLFAKRKYGTLKRLADEMGISPQQLQQYISGKREPGSRILSRLLKLGCDINWVLGGAESFETYKIYKLENEIKTLHQDMAQINSIIKKANIHETI